VHPWTRATCTVIRELTPVWWVARAIVTVTVVAQLLGDHWSTRFPLVISVLGEPAGWVLLLGAIVGSVVLGRRERTAAGRWPLAVEIVLVLAAAWTVLSMASNADGWKPQVVRVVAPPEPGLTSDGHLVQNVYP
jgi:hypothetical protein